MAGSQRERATHAIHPTEIGPPQFLYQLAHTLFAKFTSRYIAHPRFGPIEDLAITQNRPSLSFVDLPRPFRLFPSPGVGLLFR